MRWQDWARSHGVDGRSLRWWAFRLEGEERDREAPGLVELVASEARGSGFLVHVGDFRVEVEPDFDEGSLNRLLRLVRSC